MGIAGPRRGKSLGESCKVEVGGPLEVFHPREHEDPLAAEALVATIDETPAATGNVVSQDDFGEILYSNRSCLFSTRVPLRGGGGDRYYVRPVGLPDNFVKEKAITDRIVVTESDWTRGEAAARPPIDYASLGLPSPEAIGEKLSAERVVDLSASGEVRSSDLDQWAQELVANATPVYVLLVPAGIEDKLPEGETLGGLAGEIVVKVRGESTRVLVLNSGNSWITRSAIGCLTPGHGGDALLDPIQNSQYPSKSAVFDAVVGHAVALFGGFASEPCPAA